MIPSFSNLIFFVFLFLSIACTTSVALGRQIKSTWATFCDPHSRTQQTPWEVQGTPGLIPDGGKDHGSNLDFDFFGSESSGGGERPASPPFDHVIHGISTFETQGKIDVPPRRPDPYQNRCTKQKADAVSHDLLPWDDANSTFSSDVHANNILDARHAWCPMHLPSATDRNVVEPAQHNCPRQLSAPPAPGWCAFNRCAPNHKKTPTKSFHICPLSPSLDPPWECEWCGSGDGPVMKNDKQSTMRANITTNNNFGFSTRFGAVRSAALGKRLEPWARQEVLGTLEGEKATKTKADDLDNLNLSALAADDAPLMLMMGEAFLHHTNIEATKNSNIMTNLVSPCYVDTVIIAYSNPAGIGIGKWFIPELIFSGFQSSELAANFMRQLALHCTKKGGGKHSPTLISSITSKPAGRDTFSASIRAEAGNEADMNILYAMCAMVQRKGREIQHSTREGTVIGRPVVTIPDMKLQRENGVKVQLLVMVNIDSGRPSSDEDHETFLRRLIGKLAECAKTEPLLMLLDFKSISVPTSAGQRVTLKRPFAMSAIVAPAIAPMWAETNWCQVDIHEEEEGAERQTLYQVVFTQTHSNRPPVEAFFNSVVLFLPSELRHDSTKLAALLHKVAAIASGTHKKLDPAAADGTCNVLTVEESPKVKNLADVTAADAAYVMADMFSSCAINGCIGANNGSESSSANLVCLLFDNAASMASFMAGLCSSGSTLSTQEGIAVQVGLHPFSLGVIGNEQREKIRGPDGPKLMRELLTAKWVYANIELQFAFIIPTTVKIWSLPLNISFLPCKCRSSVMRISLGHNTTLIHKADLKKKEVACRDLAYEAIYHQLAATRGIDRRTAAASLSAELNAKGADSRFIAHFRFNYTCELVRVYGPGSSYSSRYMASKEDEDFDPLAFADEENAPPPGGSGGHQPMSFTSTLAGALDKAIREKTQKTAKGLMPPPPPVSQDSSVTKECHDLVLAIMIHTNIATRECPLNYSNPYAPPLISGCQATPRRRPLRSWEQPMAMVDTTVVQAGTMALETPPQGTLELTTMLPTGARRGAPTPPPLPLSRPRNPHVEGSANRRTEWRSMTLGPSPPPNDVAMPRCYNTPLDKNLSCIHHSPTAFLWVAYGAHTYNLNIVLLLIPLQSSPNTPMCNPSSRVLSAAPWNQDWDDVCHTLEQVTHAMCTCGLNTPLCNPPLWPIHLWGQSNPESYGLQHQIHLKWGTEHPDEPILHSG